MDNYLIRESIELGNGYKLKELIASVDEYARIKFEGSVVLGPRGGSYIIPISATEKLFKTLTISYGLSQNGAYAFNQKGECIKHKMTLGKELIDKQNNIDNDTLLNIHARRIHAKYVYSYEVGEFISKILSKKDTSVYSNEDYFKNVAKYIMISLGIDERIMNIQSRQRDYNMRVIEISAYCGNIRIVGVGELGLGVGLQYLNQENKTRFCIKLIRADKKVYRAFTICGYGNVWNNNENIKKTTVDFIDWAKCNRVAS